MLPQIIVVVVIIGILTMFVRGNLRYDFVSLLGLLILIYTGIIDAEIAFQGFSHPAVITVASVLIISAGLSKTGAIDRLVALIDRGPNKLSLKILLLMTITAGLSAFMNNVGALALVMPVALKIGKDKKIAPSKLLMPVAFASLLGGMITGIGTPPNLIVSTYRMQALGEGFPLFAFTPVGLSLAALGIVFTVLLGYRFLPDRESLSLREQFNIEDYLFELVVSEECQREGMRLEDMFDQFAVNVNVVSVLSQGKRTVSPGGSQILYPDDILIVEAMSADLNELITKTCFDLKGAQTEKLVSDRILRSEDIALVEVVLRSDSPLIGKTAVEARLRNRYNANLLAVSSRGVPRISRLKNLRFRSGDLLLLQAPRATLNETYTKMRALPLAEREVGISIEDFGKSQLTALGIFLLSILLTALSLLPVHVSFASAALSLILFRIITPREFYEAVEWPTIFMIGSLFALGEAMRISGLSQTIASALALLAGRFPPAFMVAIILSIGIFFTNIINNTAATILLSPIAVSVAAAMGVSPDPLLMAVCVGTSISFITPIAHQSNILIMGPGGYKFSDFWRLGLPLSILLMVAGVPLILRVWPF